MKMRFWQKTYIFTLALFLVCLNIGILSLTVYTYGKNVDAVETAVKSEQYYIAKNFERDFADFTADNSTTSTPTILMQSFGAFYDDKAIHLAFTCNGETVYSNFKALPSIEKDTLAHGNIDGKRHIIISSLICDGKYEFIMAKDVSTLDDEFKSLMITYGLTAVAVSALLAAVLYFVLKKLSSPLEKLRGTTELISNGDYSVTAEESGNDEFTLLAKSFNSMIAKINEQMKALELDAQRKQMLVDNLAHELRTPLTSIYGYAEFLEKAASDEEKRIDSARCIMSQSKRLYKISETLLDSAFIRGNPPEMTEADVSAVLSDAAEKLAPEAQKAGVTIICQAEPLVTVCNETMLSMLFYNLGENAVKACENGGTVKLLCKDSTVTVEDDGKGMTEDQLLHVTEPFYRTDKSRSRARGGAGLGLALCKQIAQTHGTSLEFTSKPGKGTSVSVTFTTLQQACDKSDARLV